MVEEDELGLAGGETPDEDVAGVRVAVDPPAEEDLRAKEVDHRVHYGAEGDVEAPDGGVGVVSCGPSLHGFSNVVVAAEGRGEDVFVGYGYTVDPFCDHDTFCRELFIDFGYVSVLVSMATGE